MLGKLPFLLLTFVLVSCEGINGKGTSSSDTSRYREAKSSEDQVAEPEVNELAFKVQRAISLNEDRSNLAQFLKSINSYEIIAFARKGSFKDHVLNCHKLEGEEFNIESKFDYTGKKAEIIIDLDTSNFSQEELLCVVKGESFSTSHTVKIRKSLVVDYVMNLKMPLAPYIELDTLVITEEGNLYTNDKNISIRTRNLISQDGKISTFLKDAQAPKNSDGLPGGFIKIKAGNISGNLNVELRGQKGGVHTTIPPQNPVIPATPDYLHGKCGDNEENTGGKCQGKKGLSGFNGAQGFKGLSGGDSGALSLEGKTISNVKLSISYFSGDGGPGGEGGLGGEGSNGGVGATVKYYAEPDHRGGCGGCKSLDNKRGTITYPSGEKGETGPRGPIGEKGVPGRNMTSTILDISSGEEIEIQTDWKN